MERNIGPSREFQGKLCLYKAMQNHFPNVQDLGIAILSLSLSEYLWSLTYGLFLVSFLHSALFTPKLLHNLILYMHINGSTS